MREILFRGFHPCEDGDKTVYVEGKAVKGRWVYWNQVGELTEPMLDGCNMHSHVSEQDVLSSTVGQYTGLTDKNGVKIFEGDIVKFVAEIENAPAVEAAPVVRGQWKIIEEAHSVDTRGNHSKHAECTNCEFAWNDLYSVEKYFKHCPNCGARMDGESNG